MQCLNLNDVLIPVRFSHKALEDETYYHLSGLLLWYIYAAFSHLELAWVLIHFNSIENMARVFLQNSSFGN